MAQLAVALLILVLLVTTAWSNWRTGRKRFAVAVLVGGLAALTLLLALAARFLAPLPALPADRITLELTGADATRSGIRLSGYINNDGDKAVSEVRAEATLEHCVEGSVCEELARDDFVLEMHVAPGQRYPFSAMVRISLPEEIPEAELAWRLAPLSALGYADGR